MFAVKWKRRIFERNAKMAKIKWSYGLRWGERMKMLSLVTLLGLQTGRVDPSLTYSQLELHTRPGHLDRWTVAETGCPCPASSQLSCPCCAPGGCPCPLQPDQTGARCVQCGLQQACLNGKSTEELFFGHFVTSHLSWLIKIPENSRNILF